MSQGGRTVGGLSRVELERKVRHASDGELRLWQRDSRRLVQRVAGRELREREAARRLREGGPPPVRRSGCVGRRNVYRCGECGGTIVTVDRDAGVTPSSLACRAKGDPRDPASDCRGTMFSGFYPDPFPEGLPEPAWEWYAPGPAEARRLDEESRDHVERGGLLLRPIKASP